MIHLDGHLVTIEVRGRTLRDSEGPATRLVLIARDISDAVALEANLARSFAKTQAILDAAPDSIVVIDRTSWWSRRAPGQCECTVSLRPSGWSQCFSHRPPRRRTIVTAELERMFAEASDEL